MTLRELIGSRANIPIVTCHPDDDAVAVLKTMIDQGLQFIPVIEHGKLVDVVPYANVAIYCNQTGQKGVPSGQGEDPAWPILAK